jgi:hypothetical protein
MSRYWAEIDSNNEVLRVVVCDTLEWLQDNLGGTWVETSDPYTDEPQTVRYCGIGDGYDPEFPERFAPPWRQPIPGIDDADGSGMGYPRGTLTFHNGRIWRSTVDGNVWEPGVSAWHDAPQIEGVLPIWVQPTGAHDTYPLDFVVMHQGQAWVSEHPANVWEPGVAEWRLRDAPSEPEIPDWKPWDGHNASLYQIGDEVMHNGTHWRATVGNNHWEPGVFGWAAV